MLNEVSRWASHGPRAHIHTHTHTPKQTRTHTHTHTLIHTCTQSATHTLTETHTTHTHAHTHTLARMHTHTLAHAHAGWLPMDSMGLHGFHGNPWILWAPEKHNIGHLCTFPIHVSEGATLLAPWQLFAWNPNHAVLCVCRRRMFDLICGFYKHLLSLIDLEVSRGPVL